MKLYYIPASCSLSPHIVLNELGLDATLIKVDHKTHLTDSGANYFEVNRLGYVPAIELDDGTLLREGPAIVQWLADQVPDKQLAPANGTLARYRLQEWLTFIGTELHKGFSPLFNPPRLTTTSPWCASGCCSACSGWMASSRASST